MKDQLVIAEVAIVKGPDGRIFVHLTRNGEVHGQWGPYPGIDEAREAAEAIASHLTEHRIPDRLN